MRDAVARERANFVLYGRLPRTVCSRHQKALLARLRVNAPAASRAARKATHIPAASF